MATVMFLAIHGSDGAAATASASRAVGVVDVTASLSYQHVDTLGTGIVVGGTDEILTNNHVIRDSTAIRVTDPDSGRTYSASVVGYDQVADVAVLELAGAPRFRGGIFGDPSKARVGDRVTAIGNAGGGGGAPKRLTGKIVAFDQSITAVDENGSPERLTGLIEVSAELTPGVSGGPLLDSAGNVIGMDTAGSGHYPGQRFNNDGFAIPIDRVLAIRDKIEHSASSATVHVGPTAFLGVSVATPGHTAGSRPVGALVTRVLPGTPAAQVGLVRGEILYAVNGRTISTPSAFTSKLSRLPVGATVRLAWIDLAGRTHHANVRLRSGPAQ
ncbi:MAG TPA: trypsin-like peptidase domain-containing protein [Gaiellaceae bacterium]